MVCTRQKQLSFVDRTRSDYMSGVPNQSRSYCAHDVAPDNYHPTITNIKLKNLSAVKLAGSTPMFDEV
jgi:hypothetical protein